MTDGSVDVSLACFGRSVMGSNSVARVGVVGPKTGVLVVVVVVWGGTEGG